MLQCRLEKKNKRRLTKKTNLKRKEISGPMRQCRLKEKNNKRRPFLENKKTYVVARAHASDQSGPRCPDSLYTHIY
jgi:hypothetical protein